GGRRSRRPAAVAVAARLRDAAPRTRARADHGRLGGGEPARPALRRRRRGRRAARPGAGTRRRPLPRARTGGAAARPLRRLDRSLALVDDRPQARRGRAALLLPALRPARAVARAA